MKTWWKISFILLAIAVGGTVWFKWKQDEPRRNSLTALQKFCTALNSNDRQEVLSMVVMPQAIQGRTAAEQVEFLGKALHDEISPEGLAVLRREGAFGPLTNLFPAEAEGWAKQAGVQPGDCVAFKLERSGICAEVVLAIEGGAREQLSGIRSQTECQYRIVRVNNVKQLAGTNFSTAN